MGPSATKTAMADAAALEFLSHGYAGASLSSIAARLGLTKGALTYHFKTKSDFAAHFIKSVRDATNLAADFSKSEYPDCGTCRLVLYFILMAHWQRTEVQCAAGMALFADAAAVTSEADEVIQSWLQITADALQTCVDAGQDLGELSILDAAEMFLVTNLGAAFFGRHVRLDQPGTKEHRFVRLALTAVGVQGADEHADAVIDRYQGNVPSIADLALN